MNDNVLIAEFIGRRGKVNKHLFWTNVPGIIWVTEKELKFDISWSWLMPVIKKINNINKSLNIKHVRSREFDQIITNLKCQTSNADIKETYVAVVDFINWINKKEL